jgi:hypothetical protein
MHQHKIRFVDEYLSLRCIALTGKFLMTKLPWDLMEKYAVICKFLIMNSAIPFSQIEPTLLKFLKMNEKSTPPKKVIRLINLGADRWIFLLQCSTGI